YWTLKDSNFKCSLPGVRAIQRALYSPKAHGIFARDMEGYLHRKGLRVYTFRGSWSVLRDQLSKGRPLIVCLREGHWLHYVVVVGLDPARNVVLVNDPAGKKLEALRRPRFEKKWSVEDRWTLLALPGSAR
ncbi:MAG: cysteine peptidase family C39 domain-containing protein, partial [Terriglobia bacterium]